MSGKKGKFNMACSLLSQMVKGQRSFGDELGIRSYRPTPTTLSLFPGADVSAETETEREKSGLTIFYNGKVLVFDDFPEEKAKDLMQLATNGSHTTVSAMTESCLPPPKLNQPNGPADLLAQTRRASLQRFLKKRKERIDAKAPYQVKSSKKMGLI